MTSGPEINIPSVVAEVRAAFDRYELGLEDNDVAVLDDTFWNHTLTQRFGVAENLYGHAEIAAFRASRTSTQKDQRARRLERTIVTTFGTDFAVANTEYVLLRNGKRGRQSQTWARFPEGWKVVSAHVSIMPDAAPTQA
ncbi:oxalurate catabolism protein HpxZ [Bordetella sp. N]|uniref:oxalurate catabolism protein HpxZ n=1 Tax=Bordetella sp. N TaxID=1746199 RepID=UPI00070C7594|nr:oxalurate catabolism protein HpxZ [Bordetella sp. N]ALM83647.1 hypothetical protein ASB57_12300 [Bordetella sp. N]